MTLTHWLCLSTGFAAGIVIGERLGFCTLRRHITHFVNEAYRLAGGLSDDDDDDNWWRKGKSPPGQQD